MIFGKGEIDGGKDLLLNLILKLDRERELKLYLRILNLLGIIERRKSNYDDANKYFEDAIKLAEENGDKKDMEIIKSNIALVAYNKGDYDTAIEIYNDLEKLQDPDDFIGIGITYNNIGLVFQAKKEFDKALEYYLKALKTIQKTGYKSLYGHFLGNCGAIYKEKKDYQIALEYYNRSLSIAKELNDKKQIGIIFSLIGVVYLELDDLQKSIDNTNNALSIYKEIGDKRLIATCYQKLGEIYIKLKRYNDAYDALVSSERLFNEIKNNVELQKVHKLMKDLKLKIWSE